MRACANRRGWCQWLGAPRAMSGDGRAPNTQRAGTHRDFGASLRTPRDITSRFARFIAATRARGRRAREAEQQPVDVLAVPPLQRREDVRPRAVLEEHFKNSLAL